MNRREKVLSVLLLLAFLACWSPVGAFALDESGGSRAPVSAVSGTGSSKAGSAPAKNSSSWKASSAPPARSSAPRTSSSKARKTTGKTVKRVVSSSVFSEAASGASSFETSSEESSDIPLPSIGSVPEEDPLSSAVTAAENSRKMNWIGILSWACIGLGILVVLIVVLGNRRPPRGMGRKRYRRPKRSNKKRLLNDKYYRHINRY